MNTTIIAQWLPLLLAAIAVAGYLETRKKITINEGARMQQFNQMTSDVKAAHDKIRVLEESTQNARVNTAEIKKDIEYIKAGQDKMEITLNELRDLIISIPKNTC